MIFPGTEVRLISLVVPQVFLSPFLKNGSNVSLFPAMGCQLQRENIVKDIVKFFTEVKVD